jgi:hypothetical protein
MHIRHTRFTVFALFIAFALTTIISAAEQQPSNPPEPFSEGVAESLMQQVRDGLVDRNPEKFLAAFDPDNTPDFDVFSGQLQAFFEKWDNIRVFYQINQTAETKCGTAACGMATVQFEMEADDVQSQLPAMRRSAQLQLTFRCGEKGWRIVNLTPRSLFQ